TILADHPSLKKYQFDAESVSNFVGTQLIFTENETNVARLFKAENYSPYVKDGFHSYVINGRAESVNPANVGTKAAAYYALDMAPGAQMKIRLRLTRQEEASPTPFG